MKAKEGGKGGRRGERNIYNRSTVLKSVTISTEENSPREHKWQGAGAGM